jgi:hypothetical protein
MEMSQGNSLCSYLKQTKTPFLFFIYKIGEQVVEQVLPGGLVPVGSGEKVGKGVGG